LSIEPNHHEAHALLHPEQNRPPQETVRNTTSCLQTRILTGKCEQQTPFSYPRGLGERFSTELWFEVAEHLPRRDLRALLYVPHVPSRVASQLLFRRVDLHFVIPEISDDSEGFNTGEEAENAQRNADILTRVIEDSHFARLIRSLRIFGSHDDTATSVSFQAGSNRPSLIVSLHSHIEPHIPQEFLLTQCRK
jgi:hypothetical protein